MSKKENKFKTPWKTDLNKKRLKKRKSEKRKSENRKSLCKVGCEPTTKSKGPQLKDRKENEEKKVEKIVENEENVSPNGVFI